MNRLLKFATILFMCISLAGCSGKDADAKSEVESKQSTATAELESEQSTATVIPKLNVAENSSLKSDTIEDIPDIDGFSCLLQNIADEMGIQPIETLTYIDCEEIDGETECKFTFPYADGEAYAYFGYDGENWLAAWVIDSKKISVYWVGDGMEDLLPTMYRK